MTRGGKREKAGRKSTWVSGCKFEDTKLIRVPTAIADKLMQLAHQLDAGESIESVTKSKKDANPAQKTQRLAPGAYGIACPKCESLHIGKDGFSKKGEQRYVCKNCTRKFLESSAKQSLDSVTQSR